MLRDEQWHEHWKPLAAKAVTLGLLLAGAQQVWQRLDLTPDRRPDAPQHVDLLDLEVPKPKEEPLPEPEPELAEEVELEAPEAEQPGEQASDDQLGLDADGAAGADAFGLKARRGGRDLLAASGPTAGRAGWQRYGATVATALERVLARHDELRRGNYRLVVRVWLGDDGRIDRLELVGTTGDAGVDAEIETAMLEAPAAGEPPPGLPQPVLLRLTARGAG